MVTGLLFIFIFVVIFLTIFIWLIYHFKQARMKVGVVISSIISLFLLYLIFVLMSL